MKSFNRLKRKSINVFKMIKYAYIDDFKLKGTNIKYGDYKKQCYKVYQSKYENKPTIFFVHGGGWWQGSPSLYSGVGKFFLKNGYTTSLVGYRLVPTFTYPEQIEDAFLALKHYIDNNPNDKRIILSGYSAGGEIASRLAFDTLRHNKYNIDLYIIKGFISISGVLDFKKCNSKYSKKLLKNYLGNKKIADTNPINLLNKESNVPTLCIHGEEDTLISVDNSISFITKLKSLNKIASLILIKDGEHEHTIDIVRGKGNKYSNYIFRFIEENSN
ncbi:alpha/beta hydrolase [Romboutsia sp.]|uniref:alpha/beta hydrolase n=1 Tax=Romboutsia sp. TaxID=1965302 RepID=UPI003F3BC5B6